MIFSLVLLLKQVYLPKLPNWDWTKGDSVICFAELKLGLIAQNCLVPGLTTLLTSLFIREDSQVCSSNHPPVSFCFMYFNYFIYILPVFTVFGVVYTGRPVLNYHSSMGFFLNNIVSWKELSEISVHQKFSIEV